MMKKWLVIFLLLASSVSAGSFLDTRTNYYQQTRRKLGYEIGSTGLLSDTVAHCLLSEAVSAVLTPSKGLKRLTFITTTFEQNKYALDTTMIGIEDVWWQKNDSLKILKPIPISLWDTQEHKTTKGQKLGYLKRPSFYDRTDSLLVLFPIPTQPVGDTLWIKGWHRFGDIDTTTSLVIIPEQFRLPILYYLTWSAADARQDSRSVRFFELLKFWLGTVDLIVNKEGQVAPIGN